MSLKQVLVLSLVLLALPAPGYAQAASAYGTARVTGSIRDSISGAPLVQAFFCAGTPGFRSGRVLPTCTNTDNHGRFVVDSLPSGVFEAFWQCYGQQWIGRAKHLGRDTLRYEAGRTTEVQLAVDGEGCDQRRRELRRGRFKGYYTSGFEVHAFEALAGRDARIWVEIGDADWPPMERTDSHCLFSTRLYVEWIGELYGPGYFGHMSGYEYQLTVDSIEVARVVDTESCDS